MKFIDPPGGHPWALLAVAGASILANVVMVAVILTNDREPEPVAIEAPADPAIPADEAVVAGDPADPALGEGLAAAQDTAPASDLHVIEADIQHSLARTFQNTAGEHADVVAAVYTRLFVWELDVRRDLQRGDSLQVAYSWDGELAHIPVATYTSGKLGKLEAFRYKMAGDTYPSWWTRDGQEVPRRLVNGPLAGNYEQITSLLKDRPSHKGMDFKLPEGSDVISPKPGTVVRTDWNLAYNGNCIEIRYDDGTTAKFLHLSDTQVKPGERVQAGKVIGLSGNTGRSTGPHLHYELERGGKVVDPVDYHGLTRRKLPESEMDAFRATVQHYDRVLAGES